MKEELLKNLRLLLVLGIFFIFISLSVFGLMYKDFNNFSVEKECSLYIQNSSLNNAVFNPLENTYKIKVNYFYVFLIVIQCILIIEITRKTRNIYILIKVIENNGN
jgi:hypothetical protein